LPNKREDLLPGEELETLPGEEVESPLQDVSALTPTGLPAITPQNALTLPERGMRALGVMTQRAASGIGPFAFVPGGSMKLADMEQMLANLPTVLERGAAAAGTGFVPERGERLGAFAGETIGSLPLAAATGGFVGPGALLRYKMLGGATSAMALMAADEMAEKGILEPKTIAFSGVLGAGLPLLKPGFQAVKNFVTSIRDVLAASVGVRPGAIDVAAELGSKLKNIDGTANVIRSQLDNIQSGLKKVHEEAGQYLNKMRERLGLPATLQEKGERRFGRRILEESLEVDPQKVAGNPGFVSVIYNDVPLILPRETVDKLKGELTEKYGQEITAQSPKQVWRQAEEMLKDYTSGKFSKMDEKAKVKSLDFLREKIGDYTDYAKAGLSVAPITKQEAAIFNDLLFRTNEVLENAGESGKSLRSAEKLYGNARQFFDTFQKNFETEEKTARTLLGLLREESPEEILGSGQTAIDGIRVLEKKVGKPLLKPLMQAISARNIGNIRARSPGAIIGGTIKEGMPETIQVMTGIANRAESFGNFTLDPKARMMGIAGAEQILEGR